jgi:NAD(P)-dependent dehydrogenase (short-subunit alcohol dehydrogenase family)
MIAVDLAERGALVTGGTRGLGRAVAMELTRAGATVYVTHRWGSVTEDELRGVFEAEGLPAPRCIEADAGSADDTRALMETIGEDGVKLEVIISNVALAKVAPTLSDLRKNALDLSLGYSAWPMVGLLQACEQVLGAFPRYLIGISSDGAQICHEGYDLAGVSKSAMETLCRYLAVRLKPRGVRVNVIRPGALDTESSRATFGEDAISRVQAQVGEVFLDPRAVARACVAMCSGLMDAVTGQVLVVDEGWSLVSPLSFVTGRARPFQFPSEGGGR